MLSALKSYFLNLVNQNSMAACFAKPPYSYTYLLPNPNTTPPL
jgi:hypothetical protein